MLPMLSFSSCSLDGFVECFPYSVGSVVPFIFPLQLVSLLAAYVGHHPKTRKLIPPPWSSCSHLRVALQPPLRVGPWLDDGLVYPIFQSTFGEFWSVQIALTAFD
jgi:hypothetical protein